MEKIIRFWGWILCVQLLILPVYGVEFYFLEDGIGSRGKAMGHAYIALSNEVDSLLWNPAGLAALNNAQFQLSHSSYFEESTLNYFGYARPDVFGFSVGGAYLFSSINGIIMRDELEAILNENGVYGESVLVVGAAKKIDDTLRIGLAGKLINKNFTDETPLTGFSLDMGVQYAMSPALDLAMNLKHVVSTAIGPDALTRSMVLGVAFRPMSHVLNLTSDVVMTPIRPVEVNVGFELNPIYMFSFRGGIRNISQLNFDYFDWLNLGTRVNFSSFTIDFSYQAHTLGNFYRIGMLFDF